MTDPLFYILAPFLLGFGLFAVYLVVSIILKDPARPFRMFKAPPIDLGEDQEPSSFAEASEDREIGNQPLDGARDRKSEESKGD